MIPTEVLTEELLQQAAAELATALNDSLSPPNECQHKFSDDFERNLRFTRLRQYIIDYAVAYFGDFRGERSGMDA